MENRNNAQEPLLQVRGLSLRFPVKQGLLDILMRRPQQAVTAVDDVDLAIYPGECLGLVGESGCGKSTLLKTALGLLPALSGEVLYDGAPLSGMPPEQVARRAAYMAQSRNVPSIEARRMVLHGRFPYLSFPRRYRKSDYAAVRRAMEKADALELADRPMQELSGGQRQKV